MGELYFFPKGDKPAQWIQFDEDTEVLLEYTEKEDLEEIREKAIEMAKFQHREDVDSIANVLLGKRKVKGWRNKDNHEHSGLIVNGEPFPFSEANVEYLMKRSLEFSAFVNQNCMKFKNFDEQSREEQTKNS